MQPSVHKVVRFFIVYFVQQLLYIYILLVVPLRGQFLTNSIYVTRNFRLPPRSRRETRALLGYYAAYSNSVPTFRENLSVHLGFLYLEDGAYRLSRNIGKELPLYAA